MLSNPEGRNDAVRRLLPFLILPLLACFLVVALDEGVHMRLFWSPLRVLVLSFAIAIGIAFVMEGRDPSEACAARQLKVC